MSATDIARKAFMAPVWLVQVFTQYKSFRENPIIGSRTLNRMGLHVSRVVLAKAVGGFRRLFLIPFVPAAYRREYHHNGFIKIEDFLPEQAFRDLRKEVLELDGEMREMTQGNTLTQMALLDTERCKGLPHCKAFVENRMMQRLVGYVTSARARPLNFIHCVKNGYVESRAADPQKTLHSDTFQPTAKYWLFLDDVETGKGSFVYAPGSHRLSRKRLAWEYDMSRKAAAELGGHSALGSFRVDEEDLAELGLEARELPVAANTLIIADTHGFHRRGDVDQPCSRLAIYGYSRVLPFNPFPGTGSRLFLKIQEYGLKQIWRKADRRAEATGNPSLYRRVPASRLKMEPDGKA